MVSFRNFATALLAVLAALLIGAVFGSGALIGTPLQLAGSRAVTTLPPAAPAVGSTPAGNPEHAAEQFAQTVGDRAVAGVLSGQAVLVVTAPGADQGDVDAVKGLVGKSGAQVVGQIGLTDAFVGTGQEERLRTVVDNIIPAGAPLDPKNLDQSSRVGDLVGAVLAVVLDDKVRPEERANAINLLRENGYLSVAQEPAPVSAAVVVTGGALPADAGDKGPAVARFAKALRDRLAAVVLAGRSGSADGSASVALVRGDKATQLSTVDNVEGAMGRVAAVLALAEQLQGRAGQYGLGAGAASPAPRLP